jgi:hypothetical protein
MRPLVRIFFESGALDLLRRETALHAILRAAIDQQILSLRARAEGSGERGQSPDELLRATGLPLEWTDDSSGCDYLVAAPDRVATDAPDEATPISFEYFCQNIRKMV